MEPRKRRRLDPTIAAAIAAATNQVLDPENAGMPQAKPSDSAGDSIPLNVIFSLMKEVIPEDFKVSNDAKVCMQECVNELIMFLTQEASEQCAATHNKILTGDDLIGAMQTLGFDEHYLALMEMILCGKLSVNE